MFPLISKNAGVTSEQSARLFAREFKKQKAELDETKRVSLAAAVAEEENRQLEFVEATRIAAVKAREENLDKATSLYLGAGGNI